MKEIWILIARTKGIEWTSAERKWAPKEKLNSPPLGRAGNRVVLGGWVGTW